jgi:hypothetical protein
VRPQINKHIAEFKSEDLVNFAVMDLTKYNLKDLTPKGGKLETPILIFSRQALQHLNAEDGN